MNTAPEEPHGDEGQAVAGSKSRNPDLFVKSNGDEANQQNLQLLRELPNEEVLVQAHGETPNDEETPQKTCLLKRKEGEEKDKQQRSWSRRRAFSRQRDVSRIVGVLIRCYIKISWTPPGRCLNGHNRRRQQENNQGQNLGRTPDWCGAVQWLDKEQGSTFRSAVLA